MSSEDYKKLEEILREKIQPIRNAAFSLVGIFGISIFGAIFWAGTVTETVNNVEKLQEQQTRTWNEYVDQADQRMQRLENLIYWQYGKDNLNPMTRGTDDTE